MLNIIYIDFVQRLKDKVYEYKVGDYVGISKYKHTFTKRYTRNWSEDDFVIKGVKNTVLCICAVNELNGE